MNILEIDNLSKSFGKKQVIKNLSMTVPEHSIFGFLGENGSGKTTTMKMILGFLKKDSGRILIHGEEVKFGMGKTNETIGFLPDVPSFYPYMTGREYLELCGEVSGMKKNRIMKRSEELLDLVGLTKENGKISGYSRGMKQRLGIAQALFHRPKLLLCDEPTSALDPVGRKEILEILKNITSQTTVLFSTHILSDVEKICDHVAILKNGTIILNGNMKDIKKKYRIHELEIEFSKNEMAKIFAKRPNVVSLKPRRKDNVLTFSKNTNVHLETILLQELDASSLFPKRLEEIEPSLESLFMEVIQ
ncbi:MAG: ABC transporter ATP-binding protein [Tissierellia bacterium]|nr:ABC transporter ATP-binding protein [Tissierellia bacterium]